MMHVPSGCPRSLFVAAMAMSVLATDPAAADAATREPSWFIVPDTTAFLGLLDRARPEFAPVGEALDRGDLGAAVAAYAAWFRARAFDAAAVTDWSGRTRDATYNTSRADGLLAGDFWDGYSVWTVPETGFDWFGSPLSCCTRFPVLGTLRQAAHHTRDAKYARFMVEHILDYMRAYPMAEFVGKPTRSGWTNHTTVAKPWYWCMIPGRLSELSETLALIRAFPEVTDRELVDILRRLYEETGYLSTEIEAWVDRRHNGGGAMIEAMAKSCAVLADFRATDAWSDVTAGLVAQYLDEAFYPDGMCVELTTAYSASVSVTQQRLAYLFRERPAILARRDKLAAMVTVLAALSDPTGLLPSFGDLRAGRLASYVHRPLAEWLEMPWIDALLSRRDEPRPPFTAWPVPGQEPWCGYYTMRSDWSRQARYLAIDGGPWGTTHQHGDRLSVALTAFGARFIIDPPGTRYASNEPDAFIGLQPSGFLHNTITIDGVDVFRSDGTVAETKVPLTNTWEHGARYSFFAGHFSFRPVKPVTWERRIVFVDGAYWLLQDVLTGDLAEAAVEQNFQFEADIMIAFDKGVTIATAPGGARLLIIPLDSALAPILTLGDTEPHVTYWPGGKPTTVLRHEDGHDQKHGRGWSVGRRGDQLIPAPAVTYTGRCTLPGILTLALVPLAPGQDLTAAPRIVSQRDGEQTLWTLPTGDGALEFAAAPGRAVVSERTARRTLTLLSKTLSDTTSPLMHASYRRPDGLEMVKVRGYSPDNGRTWETFAPAPDVDAGLPHGYRRESFPLFCDPVLGNVLRVVPSLDTPGLDPKAVEPPIALEKYYLRYRVSTDGGRTFLFDEPIIAEGFTAANPFAGVYTGRNGLFMGDIGSQILRTRNGTILIPAQVCTLGEDGKLDSPGGGFTYTDVLIIIGQWRPDHRLAWRTAERIVADPARSTRGMIEPTLAETRDGRLLCVMRGSNGGSKDPQFAIPSHKWQSVSTDGGVHWSRPEPWTYDDGEPFFSPSAMSQLLTHSSGRIFWIGNIHHENCRGNHPRHPLVIGEVHPDSLRLVRSSVIELDRVQPDEGDVNLSHWWGIEDRETGHIVVAGHRHTIGYTSRQPVTYVVAVTATDAATAAPDGRR